MVRNRLFDESEDSHSGMYSTNVLLRGFLYILNSMCIIPDFGWLGNESPVKRPYRSQKTNVERKPLVKINRFWAK